ncbi:hypothetical protein PGH07_01230 [Sulfurovum sp. zt1-1]|uniref:Uncharacterized protein n=1 Tax=Sulfurovum zhangzhouensis TaxID=3019067 RepID=A0ABT7QVC6_9BACT|nr:hypothetical protein [Sulfurovum zhangzhouensis]MDM5270794.1 hypothetical protein [Sulfurovum zhangzhouensis]
MSTELIAALENLRLVISASSKNLLTLEETHRFFGPGWGTSNLRKYLIIPGEQEKPEKEGLEYGKHYYHDGDRFYVFKDEFEKFLLARRK